MINIIFKVFRPNKIKVYIILLSFLFFSINIISLFNCYIDEKIEKETINKEINRLLYINSEDESDKFELLKELPGVDDVYYDLEPLMLNIIELGECYFKHINPTTQVKLVSKKFLDLKSNEVLISDKLLDQQGKNIKDFLYKEIRIVVQDEILKMIVAGVYSSDGFNSQYVYISNDSDVNKYITQKNSYLLLIDNVDNYDNVKQFLEKNSCSIKYIDDSLKMKRKHIKI